MDHPGMGRTRPNRLAPPARQLPKMHNWCTPTVIPDAVVWPAAGHQALLARLGLWPMIFLCPPPGVAADSDTPALSRDPSDDEEDRALGR